MASTENRQHRGAKNQALFREVNEHVRNVAHQNKIEFLCECADDTCTEIMQLGAEEYEAIRGDPHRFPVAPGHEVPDIERVVEENAQYVVVEKVGLAAAVAEKLDPRSRASDDTERAS